MEPAGAAEPAGGEFGDVEQAVAAAADEFGPVPGEEVAGGLADACRTGEQAEAGGAAAAPIVQRPLQREEEKAVETWMYCAVSG